MILILEAAFGFQGPRLANQLLMAIRLHTQSRREAALCCGRQNEYTARVDRALYVSMFGGVCDMLVSASQLSFTWEGCTDRILPAFLNLSMEK